MTHTHPCPPDSSAFIPKPTHSDPLSHIDSHAPTYTTVPHKSPVIYTQPHSVTPICTVTPPHTSHPFPHYDATHPVLCSSLLSHAVTTGDRHTKNSLRQSLAFPVTHSCTLSHTATPWTANLKHTNLPDRHRVTSGHTPGQPQPPRQPSPTSVVHTRVGVLTSWRRCALIGPFTNRPSLPGGALDSELAVAHRGLSPPPPTNGERAPLQAGAAVEDTPLFLEIAAPTLSQVPAALCPARCELSAWKPGRAASDPAPRAEPSPGP